MSERLLLDVDGFFLDHQFCGDLDGRASDEHAWMDGAPSSRR
jgi:hypothetical protein